MSVSVDESEKKEHIIITFQRYPNENIANIPRGGDETETTPVVKFYKSSFAEKSNSQEPAMASLSTTACAHISVRDAI
ncbi:hypothetical protein T03_10856 [Trichinella britovi]|uniref:Uncharacterized protein n=1 Tax=Trichinella britovi TaxID=45882 RepID=A0A0V1CH59_TRIBR|nr:hypothetical protein T03_10856 [Trichinella britovi]